MRSTQNFLIGSVLVIVLFSVLRCSDSATDEGDQDVSVGKDVYLQKCTNSAQCRKGYECDPIKKVCVESRPDGGTVCKNNLDCVEPHTECINGKCIKVTDASVDVSTDVDSIADISFYCEKDEDCNDANKICDPASHSCVDKNRP